MCGFVFDMEIIDKSPWQEHLIPLSPADNDIMYTIIKKNLANDLIEASRSSYAVGSDYFCIVRFDAYHSHFDGWAF